MRQLSAKQRSSTCDGFWSPGRGIRRLGSACIPRRTTLDQRLPGYVAPPRPQPRRRPVFHAGRHSGFWRSRPGRRTRRQPSPIEVVVEHGIARPEKEAAHWLCDRIGIEPESLGWIDWAKEGQPGQKHRRCTLTTRCLSCKPARRPAKGNHTFLKAADAWHAKQAQKRNPFEEHAKTIIAFNPPPPPPVHAIRVATGAGKTEISAQITGEDVRQNPGRDALPLRQSETASPAPPSTSLAKVTRKARQGGDPVLRRMAAHMVVLL